MDRLEEAKALLKDIDALHERVIQVMTEAQAEQDERSAPPVPA